MNLSVGVYATFRIVEFAAVERTVTLAVETALGGRAEPALAAVVFLERLAAARSASALARARTAKRFAVAGAVAFTAGLAVAVRLAIAASVRLAITLARGLAVAIAVGLAAGFSIGLTVAFRPTVRAAFAVFTISAFRAVITALSAVSAGTLVESALTRPTRIAATARAALISTLMLVGHLYLLPCLRT